MNHYKDEYDLHLFTEEIRALTGKELENYIIALSKHDRIYLDDEYFSKLMKYGKKTEAKKILKKHNIKPEKTGKYKGGKESYAMHPSIGEIKKLTGEDLENYIKALLKFNMIENDNPAFEKLMKYGKKRELKEILDRLGIKNPTQIMGFEKSPKKSVGELTKNDKESSSFFWVFIKIALPAALIIYILISISSNAPSSSSTSSSSSNSSTSSRDIKACIARSEEQFRSCLFSIPGEATESEMNYCLDLHEARSYSCRTGRR
tara:strand:- start:422 stop:1204 length:783 start_codon:yes stop_codon:yes gene_type:complete